MLTQLKNGKFFDPKKMKDMEVIDNNIVRHKGMTRISSKNKTEFQELLEKLSAGDLLTQSSEDIIQKLFAIPSVRDRPSERLSKSTDKSIMDANNDNFRRYFESLFAKKLLTYILNSPHYEGVSLLIQDMTSFLTQEYRQHNPEFLDLWEKVSKEGHQITDNDSDLFTFCSFHPDLLNLIKENHFSSKRADLLAASYELHYLTHQVVRLKPYIERHPEGIVDIYKKSSLFTAQNRGRTFGFGFNKRNPSYNLGILRSVDQAPLDLKKSSLTSQETRCADRLYMEHPKIARSNKDSWLHYSFSNSYNSHYVNGLSGSTLLEIRLVLFFIASVTNNHYKCKFINENILFGNDLQLLKNYFRLILGVFAYIEGGHTLSEILCVFELNEVAPLINSALLHKDKTPALCLQTLITGDKDIKPIILNALIETQHFYSICQQKKKIHAEIETFSRSNLKPAFPVFLLDINMIILAGFIFAVGIVAVALACTLLNVAAFVAGGLVVGTVVGGELINKSIPSRF